MLSAGDHIRNLLGTYCRLIDSGDFDAVGQLFAEATLRAEDGTLVATGAREAAQLYAGMTRRHADGTPLTQHVVANTVLEEIGEDSIRATSNYLVFQATETLPLQPIITGGYIDTFVCESDVWRFADRQFSVGRIGNLSQHLTQAPRGTEQSE